MEKAQMQERFCYYIPGGRVEDDDGYHVAVVKEFESGYYLTDWVWGPTLEDAQKIAKTMNTKLGLTDEDVDRIVVSSMFLSLQSRGTA